MSLASAPSTTAKRQGNLMQYNAKELTETIRTRLDGFGRVFGGVLDRVDGGGLVVEQRLQGKDESWSANK